VDLAGLHLEDGLQQLIREIAFGFVSSQFGLGENLNL